LEVNCRTLGTIPFDFLGNQDDAQIAEFPRRFQEPDRHFIALLERHRFVSELVSQARNLIKYSDSFLSKEWPRQPFIEACSFTVRPERLLERLEKLGPLSQRKPIDRLTRPSFLERFVRFVSCKLEQRIYRRGNEALDICAALLHQSVPKRRRRGIPM
jgi:hypothetical protein